MIKRFNNPRPIGIWTF